MSNGTPQFTTAEYANDAATLRCASCKQAISAPYYRVNGNTACANCTQQIQMKMPKDSHAAFVRGILFGVGGAILGFAIYVGFALSTGLLVGYVSLAVGFLVGKAIMMGSQGIGGRRYQIAALVLTYSAVSLSAVPIAISQWRHHGAPAHVQGAESSQTSMNVPRAIGVLALLGLASPFLELANPLHGIIGLIILFVGLRIAWKMTAGRKIEVTGPISEIAPAAAI